MFYGGVVWLILYSYKCMEKFFGDGKHIHTSMLICMCYGCVCVSVLSFFTLKPLNLVFPTQSSYLTKRSPKLFHKTAVKITRHVLVESLI